MAHAGIVAGVVVVAWAGVDIVVGTSTVDGACRMAVGTTVEVGRRMACIVVVGQDMAVRGCPTAAPWYVREW